MKRLTCLLLALITLLVSLPALAEEETQDVYTFISERSRIYVLGDTGYLIEPWKPYVIPEMAITQAQSINKVLSAFPKVESYVYLATSSRSLDMNHLEDGCPLYDLIVENYPNSKTACLPIHTLEDYCRYYYKTDHHWNYIGSYTGYTQIIRMMLGEDEPLLEPVETVEFPVYFNGSLNKALQRKNSDEKFTVYRFDYPEMTVKINGKKKKAYGKQEAYFALKFGKKAKMTNHYGEFYGGDEGLVQFCTGNEDKENIIVFCNSFSNAVKMLIASHFNNSYFIDMRHYMEDMNSKLNLTKSIKAWNVTKVLLMGDAYFFKWGTTYR